ncbi:hypothetical protein FIN92_05780 [Prevotella brunnea]|uniref:hypothetical protein n=1 Tax=Prevotella brunnea TaxID=2508867 RepID=UPI002833B74B|nr:hypothetical protein [Prevotella brunnea]MDR0186090.1 hypothetical protein [Prevotella brunnea]
MGTALLALCFCALSLILALFVGISPISNKAKVRFHVCWCYAVVDGSTNDEPLHCRAERYCERATLSSCACVRRRCVWLLLRHGKYGEVQCHEEKGGGA